MSTSNGDRKTPLPSKGSKEREVLANKAQEALFNAVGARSDLQRVLTNALLTRAEFVRSFFDKKKDIYEECDLPKSTDWRPQDFQDLYDREAIAARVVELMPKESWEVQPYIYEVEDTDTPTPFEEAWDALGEQLRPNSHYREEKGSPIWEVLIRADILSGIGRYGIILLGLDDKRELSEPVQVKKYGAEGGMKLLYLKALPESLARVTQIDGDTKSPRYGQPTEYAITFGEISQEMHVDATVRTAEKKVHWSRVIHICDTEHQPTANETYGVSRMKVVLNNLLGIRKLACASPEMYWRGAFPGLSFETHPAMGGDVDVNPDNKLKDQIENYMHSLQRYLATTGISVKTLSPTVVDPTPQIEMQIQIICIKKGCPVRIFKGSERGELASSQDDATWNDRKRGRQSNYITCRIIVPFTDRLIQVGCLPKPSDGYCVGWPDLESQTDKEKADVAVAKTGAMVQYVSGGGENLMTPMDFLVRILGFDEEEAEAILKNTLKALEEKEKEAEKEAQEAAQAGAQVAQNPPGTAPGGGGGSPPYPPKGGPSGAKPGVPPAQGAER